MSKPAQHPISRLFTESRDALRRYVRRYVRSDETAEEVVQEAFLRTYEKGDAVQTPRAFLFSTAHNLATDLRRRDRTVAQHPMGDDESGAAGMETSLDEALIADEFSHILKQAIDLLPPQRQAALTLRVFHGRSYKEIGEILGISWRTVEKHVVKGTSDVQKYVLERYQGGQHG
jgi:RNA polymerase sigma-70 factor (ECF subfamily)